MCSSDLLNFSPDPNEPFPSLNIHVMPRQPDGTFNKLRGMYSFQMKWYGGDVHLNEVFMDEVVSQDQLNAAAITGNPRQKLAIQKQRFTQGGFGYIHRGFTNKGLAVVVKKPRSRKGQGEEGQARVIAGAYFEAAMSTAFGRNPTASGKPTGHPNILGLLNYVQPIDGPPWLVYYHMEHGSLFDVLRDNGPGALLESPEKKMKVTLDVVSGMEYLHSRKCIHRDLTPRNVLIGMDLDTERSLIAKITDFGLSAFLDGTRCSLRIVSESSSLWWDLYDLFVAIILCHVAPEI